MEVDVVGTREDFKQDPLFIFCITGHKIDNR